METLDCSIYKSIQKMDTYLFVPRHAELENLPATLLKMLGKLEHVMDLSLSEERKLARNNSPKVIQSLKTEGYYLQIPAHSQAISY